MKCGNAITYLGQKGARGLNGRAGSNGLRGLDGFPGNDGDKGDKGFAGLQGRPGLNGDRGKRPAMNHKKSWDLVRYTLFRNIIRRLAHWQTTAFKES